MTKHERHFQADFLAALFALLALLTVGFAAAQKAYDDGASDTEIKIGNIAPYTGWGKEYAAIAKAEAAYFQMVNDHGGVNGRKIVFLSEDNTSDLTKTTELAHK